MNPRFHSAAIAALLLLTLRGAAPGQNEAAVQRDWKRFRDAVARGDRRQVADMTMFPFAHPSPAVSTGGKLSREEFLANFDRIFSAGMKKQVSKGSLRKVTAADFKQAKTDGLDPCGATGEYILELPAAEIDANNDDEAFLHCAFRVVRGRLMLCRVIGCS